MLSNLTEREINSLTKRVKEEAARLGFQQCAITTPNISGESERLREWLARGYQGEMSFLEQHLEKRLDPKQLVPGTERILLVRMDYLPTNVRVADILKQRDRAYIARYALGRDYHRLMRNRLKKLGQWLQREVYAQVQFRPFVDSAPILERPLARKAGLGWIGKHTLLLNRNAGSWFFLGSLFTDVPLAVDTELEEDHCGRCSACMDICPTQAFPKPYVLDARRCISYLTIEHRGSIPVELRPMMGNRVFGCDDCQLICPWNRFARRSEEDDFKPRHQLDQSALIDLFRWSEEEFLARTEGSAIRRTGYEGWLRNLAIGLGNGPRSDEATAALKTRLGGVSDLVDEHIIWALDQLNRDKPQATIPLFNHPDSDRVPS